MNKDLMKICYKGDTGAWDIRTIVADNILHASLRDVLNVLDKENKSLNEPRPESSPLNMISGIVESMEREEYIMVPALNPSFPTEEEVFVTQPGLYRVLSGDKSKAGKKFQKWLFHEVIPSIAQHGSYPPPQKPKGSVLSQMAEILAQNSRMLADAIERQDKLENEVNDVKTKLVNVEGRVASIEAEGQDLHGVITVRERIGQKNISVNAQKELEIVAWCENLSLSKNVRNMRCPTGERLNARYFVDIIDEAIGFVMGAPSE